MIRKIARAALSVLLLVSVVTVVVGVHDQLPASAGTLSNGQTTMVSANAAGTDSAPDETNTNFGSDSAVISEDGKTVAFVSRADAATLVNNPLQSALQDDNDTFDVFLWESRDAPLPPLVTAVSVTTDNLHTGNDASDLPILAPLGAGLVFRTKATNLGSAHAGSTFNYYGFVQVVSNVFGLKLINQASDGTPTNVTSNADISIAVALVSIPPSVRVAFTSNDSQNLGAGNATAAPGGVDQVWVRTLSLGVDTTQLISAKKSNPNVGTAGGAEDPMLSADGNHIVFSANGDDLVEVGGGTSGDIFERSLFPTLGATVRVSDSGGDGTGGNSNPVVSADGNVVAWESNSPKNIGLPDSQQLGHVFARVGPAPIVMVDHAAFNPLGFCNQNSNNPGVSQDGSVVVFESHCSNMDTAGIDGNGNQDVYKMRLGVDVNAVAVSVTADGTNTGNADSRLCPTNNPPHCGASTNVSSVLNADGTAIAFTSGASNLTPVSDNHGNVDVFVRYPDGPTANTVQASLTGPTNGEPSSDSRDGFISSDGSTVVFTSLADDMVGDPATTDTNASPDVFIRDLHTSYVIEPISAVDEGAGKVTVTVTRVGNTATNDDVDFATADGTFPDPPIISLPPEITDAVAQSAHEPDDYEKAEGTLHFPPGTLTQTFDVNIVDDPDVEPSEVFHISLSPSGGAGSVLLPSVAGNAYVVILDNDVAAQDWSVDVTTEPPATAQVGDHVTVKATVSVDAGADDLTINDVTSGAGTAGLGSIQFDSTSATVSAGTTKEITATATVTATPGGTAHLEVDVDGTLGSANDVKSDTSGDTSSTEAVTATLSGGPASVAPGDPITYTLSITNDSDTDAQLTIPTATFTNPANTDFVSRTDGTTTLAAGANTTWTVDVTVAAAAPDATVITQAPSGDLYAMSDISLADRSIPITPPSVSSTVSAVVATAPLLAVTTHTAVDADAGTLLPGDAVNVTEVVTNNGTADTTTASMTDTLTDLQNPTNIQLDGAACGACSSTTGSVTAPLGVLAPAASRTITFTATVPASPGGSTAKSSAVVTFAPADPGTSPTTADEVSLGIGQAPPPQDWAVAISQEPPASAEVGDLVTIEATITVDNGSDPLDLATLGSGAGTAGLSGVQFDVSAPTQLAAGSTTTVTATATVSATPGSNAHLEVAATGAIDGSNASRSDTSGDVASGEAVTATLTGGGATVAPGDPITYHLVFTNASDTAAQLTVPAGGYDAPGNTTFSTRTDGTTSVAAGGTSTWDLTVTVDAGAADGTVITQAPSGVEYAMSAVSLADRAVGITPSSVSSTVDVAAPPSNTAPSGSADSYETDEDTPLTVLLADGVLGNDSDGENDTLHATLGSLSNAHGTVDLADDGTFTFTPAANFNGTATFTYTVDDGLLDAAAPTTVTITVHPVNDAPQVVDDAITVLADSGPVVFDLLTNDVDVDGDQLTVTLGDLPDHGDLDCTPQGHCTYTPDAGFVGSDSFTYTVSDGQAQAVATSPEAKVTIAVTARTGGTGNTGTGTTGTGNTGTGNTGTGTGTGNSGRGNSGGTSLPRTGANVGPLLGLAGIVIGLGGLFLDAAERIRRRQLLVAHGTSRRP